MIKHTYFDTLSHPSLTGMWFGKNQGNTFEVTEKVLRASGAIGACAVALPDMEDYTHQAYYDACKATDFFYPVASLNILLGDVEKELNDIFAIGFRAIKIHSRLNKACVTDHLESLERAFKLCADKGITVFFCTYYHDKLELLPEEDLLTAMTKLLKRVPNVKIVLLHGGDVNLMRFAQLARFNSNILIDLSYTMMKFRGSSLDMDIHYLMRNLEQRISVGSDYPDFPIEDYIFRLNEIADGVPKEKLEQVFTHNIQRFLGIA